MNKKNGEIKGHYKVMLQINNMINGMITDSGTNGVEIDYIVYFFTCRFPVSETYLRKRVELLERLNLVKVTPEGRVFSCTSWNQLMSQKSSNVESEKSFKTEEKPYEHPKL